MPGHNLDPPAAGRTHQLFVCLLLGAMAGGLIGAAAGIYAMKRSVDAMIAKYGGAVGEVALIIPLYAVFGVPVGVIVGGLYFVLRRRRNSTA